MKKISCYILILLVFFNCENKKNNEQVTESVSEIKVAEFAIIIHGGAGTILKENMSEEKEAAYKTALEEAIKTGYEILKNGGSSIDAVQKTINVMEDSPLFNAGKGAVFTNAETNELDASIMDGSNLNAGASAGTKTVKNPINLAKAIMENSPHVMLSGEGAELFAQEQNLEIVSPDYFLTERRLNSIKKIKEREQTTVSKEAKNPNSKFGTVGCAALDKNGNLAAGTSTGGMTNKRWGRIGDSPIIGAGTYANNNTCAVSSTGWGEYFIRVMVAHDISALMEYKNLSLEEAAKVVLVKVKNLGGDGGIVAVDKSGNMVAEFNTAGMYRAKMNDEGKLTIGIYNE